MSLTLIKEQLHDKLEGVEGIVTAYDDLPDQAPINADCPATIMGRRTPFLTWRVPYCGTLEYTWHFQVLFLYKPAPLDSLDEVDAALEVYPARFVAAFVNGLTYEGNAIATVGIANRVDFQQVEYLSKPYWGFVLDMDISENVTATFAA